MEKEVKPRLSWRQVPRETGLRAVVQGERGYNLYYGDIEVASVAPLSSRMYPDIKGYYWSCPTNEKLGIRHLNTASLVPFESVAAAKSAAKAYIDTSLRGKGLR